jgi:hypothetical protein
MHNYVSLVFFSPSLPTLHYYLFPPSSKMLTSHAKLNNKVKAKMKKKKLSSLSSALYVFLYKLIYFLFN